MSEEQAVVEDVVEPVVEQEESANEEVTETPEGEAQAEGDEVDEKKDPVEESKQSRVQRRIDKLTREKYQLKGELEAMRRMQSQQVETPAPQGKPTREQFNDDAEWIEALTDYKTQQAVAGIEHKTSQEKVKSTFNQQLAQARDKYDDFDDVLEDVQSISVSQPINDALASSPYAAEILYTLGNDLKQATALAQMPIPLAIKELGKIEARIEAREVKPKEKKTTNAPAPIKPVKSKGNVGLNHLDPKDAEKMDIGDWIKAEKERKKKR